jgi:uncharacterized damage-inducible protein DinB
MPASALASLPATGAIVEDTCAILRQGIALARDLDADEFRQPEPAAAGSSVGDHLRHNIDHFLAFLAGWETGRIDYDQRARDDRLATDPGAAAALQTQLLEGLTRIGADDLNREIRVHMDSGPGDVVDSQAASSVYRELQFLISHTVHHYALIAFICRSRGRALPADFGVAPSTLRHRRSAPAT